MRLRFITIVQTATFALIAFGYMVSVMRLY